MKVGILHDYATGVVVEDRVLGESTLKVALLDVHPNLTGEMNTITEDIECKVVIKDALVDRKITVQRWIPATWYNGNANRQTPPDVMYGERVRILKVADKEEYYWEEMSVDNHLRTTERIIFYISNTNPEDRANKVLSAENCYLIEFNTIDKRFTIKTNKNDDEPFAHELLLNTLEGYLKYSDDVGNHFLVDSANTVIEMLNKDGTQYRLDKENILEKCSGNLTREIGGNLVERVGGSANYQYGGSVSITASSYSISASFSLDGEASMGNISADDVDVKNLTSTSFNYP